jgi:histidine triad (HIT) family protein
MDRGLVVGDCVFCDIVAGTAPCHKVWEDEEHLAFLSIFPNTRGFTVVIPKQHHPSYAFELSDEVLSKLIIATKRVARLLDSKLEGVGRTGMFFEGFGVDHVHSKLSPMHGTAGMSEWRPILGDVDKYFDQYEGYLSSHDWKRADDAELAELARLIRE